MIIAICNQKGGVGKTAVATELARHLTLEGRKVLLVDMDPQASATSILGVDRADDDTPAIFDLLGTDPPTGQTSLDAALPAAADWGPIACLPAERALADVESDSTIGREMRLRHILTEIEDAYDDAVIDCPPALGVLTANALVAASRALLVTEPRVESAQALAQALQTIANVKAYYNPNLLPAGILINRLRGGRRDQAQWVQQIHEIYRDLVLEVQIPEREALARGASDSIPVDRIPGTAEIAERLDSLARTLLKGQK